MAAYASPTRGEMNWTMDRPIQLKAILLYCRFRFQVPVANSRHPVQELQIGGTNTWNRKSVLLPILRDGHFVASSG